MTPNSRSIVYRGSPRKRPELRTGRCSSTSPLVDSARKPNPFYALHDHAYQPSILATRVANVQEGSCSYDQGEGGRPSGSREGSRDETLSQYSAVWGIVWQATDSGPCSLPQWLMGGGWWVEG